MSSFSLRFQQASNHMLPQSNHNRSPYVTKLNSSVLPVFRNKLPLPYRVLRVHTFRDFCFYILFLVLVLCVTFKIEYYIKTSLYFRRPVFVFMNRNNPNNSLAVYDAFELEKLRNEIQNLKYDIRRRIEFDEQHPLGSEHEKSRAYDKLFQTVYEDIRKSIVNAYLSVHKQIDLCPLDPSRAGHLEGPLNVTRILEDLELANLVQFHERNAFNLSTNNYNDNNLLYLNETKFKLSVGERNFGEFWHLWHSSNVSALANASVPGDVRMGGQWKPSECVSRFKVAVIIPYRDRLPHLRVLISYLHLILQRQLLDYRIYVVEPTTPMDIKFNKGRVMNSGSSSLNKKKTS
jgi:hypothetical protein